MRSGSFTRVSNPVTVPRDHRVALGMLQIGSHHFAHELSKGNARCPPQLLAGLGRIPEQGVDLRRSEVARVDSHDDAPRRLIDAPLVEGVAFPTDALPKFSCG